MVGKQEMADEETIIINLRDDFYRDGFSRSMWVLGALLSAIFLLAGISLYIFLTIPPPRSFLTQADWRLIPDVPVNQPYLKAPDLIQWVSDRVPDLFNFDFLTYNEKLNSHKIFFTENGWKAYLQILNNLTSYNDVVNGKLFVNSNAAGAPFVVKQGILEGRYGWWIQIPIEINYSKSVGGYNSTQTFQILVVRSSTLTDINGVVIDNLVLMPKGGGDQPQNNAPT